MPKTINLKFPLRSYRKGFFEGNETTIDATRENIKILLLTKKGERLSNPDIGLEKGLISLAFEQIDLGGFQKFVEKQVRDAVKRWIPNVQLQNVEVFNRENLPPAVGTLRDNEILIRMNYLLIVDNKAVQEDAIQLKIQENTRNYYTADE